MAKYKFIAEYERYYLCKNEHGFNECFLKTEYMLTEDKEYVTNKRVSNNLMQQGLPKEELEKEKEKTILV